MYKVLHYYGRYQGLKQGVSGLPSWGKPILVVAALPGIVLMVAVVALSIVLFLVSLLALLLLTVPVYRVLRALNFRAPSAAGQNGPVVEEARGEEVFVQTGPRRQIDVKIIE